MYLSFQIKERHFDQEISRLRQKIFFHLVCAVGLSMPFLFLESVRAQAPTVVEELLQLDTQAALLSARQKVVGPLTASGPATALSTENILVAIYGVGQSLSAEVILDSEPHVFKNRRLHPLSGRSTKYTLDRIKPPCVHLKKEEILEILCLGQGRP